MELNMIELKDLMKDSLVPLALERGGTVKPLIIPAAETGGLGLCNPSIYHVPKTTKYLINMRNVSYYLHHCEGDQKYQTPWGPLNYVRPDNDAYLRTTNFICDYSISEGKITKHKKVDTSKFTKEPEWDFVGLEDGRIVKWEGKTYLTGVRRYAPDGKGRMVLSEIEITKKGVKEVGRYVMDSPNGPEEYCEKNWMPILDMPFHYVHTANPLKIVKVDINEKWKHNPIKYRCPVHVVHQGKEKLNFQLDPRGSSQLVPFKDGYLCVTHECDYWTNVKEDRDAHYYHRFIHWDKEWNVTGYSKPYKFMDGRIEFCCGMASHPDKDCDDMFITYGFQDNSAYILQIKESHILELLEHSKKE